MEVVEGERETKEPKSVGDVLFEMSGGTQGGIKCARESVVGGDDPVEKAKAAAGRGVLGEAAEYIQVSGLDENQKVRLYCDVSETVQRGIVEARDHPVNEILGIRATAVQTASRSFLESHS